MKKISVLLAMLFAIQSEAYNHKFVNLTTHYVNVQPIYQKSAPWFPQAELCPDPNMFTLTPSSSTERPEFEVKKKNTCTLTILMLT